MRPWHTLIAAALLILPCTLRAQGPEVFTIDTSLSTLSGTYVTFYRHPKVLPTDMSPAPCTSANPYCGVETNWPEPCPPGLSCDPGGEVQLTGQGYVSGLSIPWYLGFPNNGFLLNDCSLVYGPTQFNPRPDGTMSDGTEVGDTWSFSGNASCSGYAEGVAFSVTTNWALVSITTRIGYGGVSKNYTYRLTGGSGVAQGPNPPD